MYFCPSIFEHFRMVCSDFFDLCLHWVSVVPKKTNVGCWAHYDILWGFKNLCGRKGRYPSKIHYSWCIIHLHFASQVNDVILWLCLGEPSFAVRTVSSNVVQGIFYPKYIKIAGWRLLRLRCHFRGCGGQNLVYIKFLKFSIIKCLLFLFLIW